MENSKLKFKIQNGKKLKKELTGLRRNVPLADYTTLKIGGPAQYFFAAKTKQDLVKAIKTAKKIKLPFFILGGGSNLLIADEGYNGLIIKIQNAKFKMQNENSRFKIICEAGTPLPLLASKVVKNNLSGLEWSVGIPGTIGGAIYGNAGAFGGSMAEVVKSVEVFDIKDLRFKTYDSRDCKFGYRDSIFKKNKNLIILSAILELKRDDKREIENKVKRNLERRKKSQPLGFPTAGSVFKNPSGVSAGELIEKCGLKGKRIGNAQISKKHANFIVNLGNARAKEVISLINLIKRQIKNKHKITLKEEIQFLGF